MSSTRAKKLVLEDRSSQTDVDKIEANIRVLEKHLFDNYKRQNELNSELNRLRNDIELLKSAKNKLESTVAPLDQVQSTIENTKKKHKQLKQAYDQAEEKVKTMRLVLNHLERNEQGLVDEIKLYENRLAYNNEFFKKVFDEVLPWQTNKPLDENLLELKKMIEQLKLKSAKEVDSIKTSESQLKRLEEIWFNEKMARQNEIAELKNKILALRQAHAQMIEETTQMNDHNLRMQRSLTNLSERTELLDLSMENKQSLASILPSKTQSQSPEHRTLIGSVAQLLNIPQIHPEKIALEREVAELEIYYHNALKTKSVMSHHFKTV